jgi:hypothetical protein
MRYFFLIIALFVALPNIAEAQKRFSLRDAILKKIVTAEFKGLGGFNNKAVELVVNNKTKDDVEITFDAGEFLQPSSATMQRLLTAEAIVLTIKPKQTAQQKIYAFCSQHSKGSPALGVSFSPTGKAGRNLCSLMELVIAKKYYTYAAQEAVWCLTDNNDIQWLMSNNTQEEKDLRELVAAAKGIDLSKLPKVKRSNYTYEFVGRQTKRPKLDIDYTDRTGGEKGKKIENAQKARDVEDEKTYKEAKEMENWTVNEIVGTLNVAIKQPSKIRVVIVSPSGEQLVEVYKSEDVVAGKAKLPYKYQKYNLPRGIYKVQVIDDRGGVLHSEDYELKN